MKARLSLVALIMVGACSVRACWVRACWVRACSVRACSHALLERNELSTVSKTVRLCPALDGHDVSYTRNVTEEIILMKRQNGRVLH